MVFQLSWLYSESIKDITKELRKFGDLTQEPERYVGEHPPYSSITKSYPEYGVRPL